MVRGESRRRGDRVIEYIRVSTVREEMISPEVQHQHNLRAAERESLRIVATVQDLDLSGRDFARRKVGWMIDEIREDRADGVLTWKVSRWGRNLLHSSINVQNLQEAGGYLVSSTEPLGEIDSPMGRFSLAQLLVIAQLQSDQIRESWLDAKANRLRNGLPGDGHPRFGYVYDRDAREYRQDPATAPWLKRAYEQYAIGKPLSHIVAEMGDKGVRGGKGSPMTYTAMLGILDSGFGAGLLVRHAYVGGSTRAHGPGKRHYLPGKQDPVIDQETWVAFLARRGQMRAPRHVNPVTALAGLVRCGFCRSNMYRSRDGNAYQWVCERKKLAGGVTCEGRPAIRQHKVDTFVRQWLLEKASGFGLEEAQAKARAGEVARANIDKLRVEATDLTKALLRVEDRLARGKIDEEHADTLKAQYESELAALTSSIAREETAATGVHVATPDMFEALVEMWDSDTNPAMVNAALREVIRGVVIEGRAADRRIVVVPAWEVEASPAAAASE